MSLFLAPSEFTGKYKISKNCYYEDVLQEYIDQYEDLYMCKLLGADLYTLFKADLVAGVPVSAIYLSIYNAFCKDLTTFSGLNHWYSNRNCLIQSQGIKTMLKGFIYYHYISAEAVKSTITGLTKGINENSSVSSYEMIYRTSEIRFNESLESFISIQTDICENLTNYPDWNGIKLDAKFYGVL